MPVLSVVNTYSAVITLGRTIRPDDALMFRMLIDVNQCPMACEVIPAARRTGSSLCSPGIPASPTPSRFRPSRRTTILITKPDTSIDELVATTRLCMRI